MNILLQKIKKSEKALWKKELFCMCNLKTYTFYGLDEWKL